MERVSIIPTPKRLEQNGRIRVGMSVFSSDFENGAQSFASVFERLWGKKPENVPGGIEFCRDGDMSAGEYRIECQGGAVREYALDRDGALYGAATLLQLARPIDEGLEMPLVSVYDKPDCSYRSLMLDLAFKYHTLEQLFGMIDLCFLYKIKYLHLHFIDNKSYTLPSREFPRLPTEGLSYSFDEIERLNGYAEARGVEIIPELELPGHSAALVSAYPELFGVELDTDPAAVSFRERFNNNVISVGRPGVMENIERLMREIIAMFPNSRYLHVGGDEAQIESWEHCVYCKRYMKENGISGVYPLYSHFEKLVTDKVLELGRTPVVWEGFPKEGAEAISRDVIVIAWESLYHLAPDLVEEGFKIVNASWQPLYLVVKRHWSPEDILDWNIYNWQNWWERSYAYNNPINLPPTDSVLGGQISSWWGGEYDEEIKLIKSNLAALSERTWNIDLKVTKDEFGEALRELLPLADRLLK